MRRTDEIRRQQTITETGDTLLPDHALAAVPSVVLMPTPAVPATDQQRGGNALLSSGRLGEDVPLVDRRYRSGWRAGRWTVRAIGKATAHIAAMDQNVSAPNVP